MRECGVQGLKILVAFFAAIIVFSPIRIEFEFTASPQQ
jgi:hypothetical protein